MVQLDDIITASYSEFENMRDDLVEQLAQILSRVLDEEKKEITDKVLIIKSMTDDIADKLKNADSEELFRLTTEQKERVMNALNQLKQ
jgi:gas vesicle protein